jgi:hypothetical protein
MITNIYTRNWSEYSLLNMRMKKPEGCVNYPALMIPGSIGKCQDITCKNCTSARTPCDW